MVTVRLSAVLRPLAGGRTTVRVGGATAADVLEDLFGRFPALRARVLDEQGEVRRYVGVYLNGEDLRVQTGMSTQVADGDELELLHAVAGG